MTRFTRRRFVQTAATAAVAAPWMADLVLGAPKAPRSKNDRFRIGAIGVGGRGTAIMRHAMRFGDVVAVCDVDRKHAERARQVAGGKAEIYEDYRKLLDRKDIDFVTIGTPDHWHTAPCIAALKAGKDVYCEKPLTLTVEEGQILCRVVKQTGRVLQVGTQQRSEMGLRFLRAVATVRSGQLGTIRRILVQLPLSTKEGGPFPPQPVPDHLNWDFWLGQAPKVPYCPQRCHFTFRWWYEYSGGIMTDWGAHHMDIVQWALDVEHGGPESIDGSRTKMPNIPGGYNTPKYPVVDMVYPGGVKVEVRGGNEGILFEGTKGRIYVNRGRITGKPIELQDQDRQLREPVLELMGKLYRGSKPGSHMGNFVEAVRQRSTPVSDVVSQHRSVSACHLANISCRLQRKLRWDAKAERFIGDDEANGMLSRPQRAPYQIEG